MLSAKQFTTASVVTTITDDDGDAVNVTGADARLTIFRQANPLTPVFDVAGVVTNGAAGQITFTFAVAGEKAGRHFAEITVDLSGVISKSDNLVFDIEPALFQSGDATP
jgi:hypothetical protein